MDMNGLDLSQAFFHEVVEPIVAAVVPGLRYAAALIGSGSEVIGNDDATSRDHDWAPRATLLLPDDADAGAILAALDQRLPETFAGHRVRICPSDPGAGFRSPHPGEGHRVAVTTLAGWLGDQPGWSDPASPAVADWLGTPQQRLLEVTAGRVFRDDIGELTDVRDRLAWYPDDVWRYLLACQWQRVAQLEPFVGRTGDVGDDLGSRLVAASLVRDAMRLTFLIGRQYAPYDKWIGTAFSRLPMASTIQPSLTAALSVVEWRDRETAVVTAMVALAQATNALGLAAPVDTTPRLFYDRPYRVLDAHRFRTALDQRIADPAVRAVIDDRGWVGSVDQWSDSVDLLTANSRLVPRFSDGVLTPDLTDCSLSPGSEGGR